MNFITAKDLSTKFSKKEISSYEITKMTFERISESKLNTYISTCKDLALKAAKEADKKFDENSSEITPLTGVPVMIKDNISTKNIETTAASKILKGYIPPFDATVVKQLKNAGAVILGKGNMDEFAMGSSNETSAYGPVLNPWDTNKVPGGSSGGAASAVAAGECFVALGSDTGGSIRQPASLCGVVGMKPTYGLVSRYGLIAFGSSLDQIGPITRSVEDCGNLLNIIAQQDSMDATSVNSPYENFTEDIYKEIKGIKLGVPKEYITENIDSSVKDNFLQSLEVLSDLGANIEEISLPLTEYALAVYYIIAPSEASANLSRFDGVKYGLSVKNAKNSSEYMREVRGNGFGDEVKRRILIGTYALSSGYYDAYYKKAQQVRTLIIKEFNDAFKNFDALVTPTSPILAFDLESKNNNPLSMYMNDICTIPANIAGLPAISIPSGISKNLPIGLQFIGPQFGDKKILQIASNFEKATDWHKLNPL
ncbi:MAG: Asp-tRNA(Asn)/Glu-tRNA(Gln) amidotransferase subunit GatA [Dehalococcoidia bacterium]